MVPSQQCATDALPVVCYHICHSIQVNPSLPYTLGDFKFRLDLSFKL